MDLTIEVDPGSLVPAHRQVYEGLRDRLAARTVPAGARLPTERELAERLGLSRGTVRSALLRLERDGLIVRRQGRGTFVAEPRIEHDVHLLSGFSREFARRGLRVTSRVLSMRQTPPPAQFRHLLRGDLVVEVRRLRSLDSTPVCLESVWLPADPGNRLLGQDLTDRSIYAALWSLGAGPVSGEEQFSAVVLDDYEATCLGVGTGSAGMLVERTALDATGRCVECTRAVLRADKVVLRAALDVDPDADPAADPAETSPPEELGRPPAPLVRVTP